ncbi:MAG: DUF4956 domain-containing protein [Chitinophagales bacterium]|nr:DUF4956 domain-containing protein [Chitinophagales bacterium]
MLDFSLDQATTEHPTLWLVAYSMLLAFLLSVLLAFTYEKTHRELHVPGNFMQAMVLSSIVSTTIMLAIGDSLARGLGILGALAIIRFRSTLRGPRNMIFMLSGLSIGIACGVYAYNVAVVGTLGFCLIATILRFTPFSKPSNLVTRLRVRSSGAEGVKQGDIELLLKQFCYKFTLIRLETEARNGAEPKTEYQYVLQLKTAESEKALNHALMQLESITDATVDVRNQPEEF